MANQTNIEILFARLVGGRIRAALRALPPPERVSVAADMDAVGAL